MGDGRIATDEEIERAVDWLRDNASAIGQAREAAMLSSNWIKHVEALEMLKSDARSADMRKAEARASEAFRRAIIDEARAHGEFEKMKSRREAAQSKIEAWRSQSANYRGIRI